MSTPIFYYVPEDHETVDQLNFFRLNKPMNDIRLNDIKLHFPVPGDYHFRFQFNYSGTLVWLDLSNDECALP